MFQTRKRWGVVLVHAAAALGACASIASADVRAYDGVGNNQLNTQWGCVNSNLLRVSAPAYLDGLSMMPRAAAPNPRDISNLIVAQPASAPNSRNLSDFVWQWGQFVDHDLDLTKLGSETANIATQAGDPMFHGTPIGFSRSQYDPASGVSGSRQQPNAITSYLDASMVYGSSASTAGALRAHSGGRLLTQASSTGALLPTNSMGLDMGALPGSDPTTVFAAGDGRANEQPGLTAMHTLFVREHNRLADALGAANPGWNDDQIFETARKIVGAEIQKITYQDWLPALIGGDVLGTYTGYKPEVDAGIATEFSTAAFRIGHTMLNGTLLRLDNNGSVIAEGNLDLRNAFFTPDTITAQGGISPLLKGLASQAAQEIDVRIVDDVREFLFGPFGPPGSVGFDLASLNIQRGRDHGLCDYNTMRAAYGLSAFSSFSQISSDASLVSLLESMYGDISSIDPWIGMLAEDHLAGGSVGELMAAVILEQFARTRDGDRYFYLNDMDLLPYLGMIESMTLADIIRLNTDITNLQVNVFFVPGPAGGALALVGAAVLGCRRRRGGRA